MPEDFPCSRHFSNELELLFIAGLRPSQEAGSPLCGHLSEKENTNEEATLPGWPETLRKPASREKYEASLAGTQRWRPNTEETSADIKQQLFVGTS